ncbi:hypothetical protein AVEN_116774-1 [Araneus ventricosus]|uniref:C2H2-type domain-containing protein n=1 Tax=Araneus ventricosus TaxID=182803 RepID=A0A4Y2D6M3_ARAVE|nr:hypothetical protein AVEN_116774-1 [Araneus ventricosus]
MKKHGDDVNHACSQCSMKFYRVNKLREHTRTHTRKKKKTYPCEHCAFLSCRIFSDTREQTTPPPAPRIAAVTSCPELWSESSGSVFFPFHDADSCWKWDYFLKSFVTNPRHDRG